MADSIKSALEIALAKAEAASEEITDEDRLRWKYVPEGEKLGARIIKGTVNIEEELENMMKPLAPSLPREQLLSCMQIFYFHAEVRRKKRPAKLWMLFFL